MFFMGEFRGELKGHDDEEDADELAAVLNSDWSFERVSRRPAAVMWRWKSLLADTVAIDTMGLSIAVSRSCNKQRRGVFDSHLEHWGQFEETREGILNENSMLELRMTEYSVLGSIDD